MPGLLNYTTTISAMKTISEMQNMLVIGGASSIAVHYNEDRLATGISFQARTKYGQQTFTMPVDITAVQRVLAGQRTRGSLSERMKAVAEQAERTSWRVAKSWLEAQLALIQIGMASLDQVMLPYMHVGPELTMYDAYQERQDVLQLEGGQQ